MSKKVVYASCGSNLRTERFMAYINGGTIKGASRDIKVVGTIRNHRISYFH